jgi:1,4-alpha-glucan branching enzyme
MATVETSARGNERNWFLRTRTLRASPAALLAIAATLAFVAIGANNIATRLGAERVPPTAAMPDTVYLVRFVFTDDAARSVALVGSFNDWTKDATPMTQTAPGVWSVTVPMPAGRQEYAFVLRDASGERWAADPTALLRRDEFGTESSIVSVGAS